MRPMILALSQPNPCLNPKSTEGLTNKQIVHPFSLVFPLVVYQRSGWYGLETTPPTAYCRTSAKALANNNSNAACFCAENQEF